MDIKRFIFVAVFLVANFSLQANTEPTEDKQALRDFYNNINHTRSLNWNDNSSACDTWTGVTCNHDKSQIIAVRLPGLGLRGQIPLNTLSRLSALQILSLRYNGLWGDIPSDFVKLGNLTALFLEFNYFGGGLPEDFSVWKNLSIVNLSNNDFNGSIPSSISSLSFLTALDLANNSLSGQIPDINQPSLQVLDLSNNELTGNVPQSLQRFPSSAFLGNNVSFVSLSPPLHPNAQPSKKTSKLSEPALLGIIIGGCTLMFVIISVLLIVCYTNNGGELIGVPEKPKKKERPVKKAISGREDKDSSLVFFEGCSLAFDLEDLLRASAEVLGKGTFGTTYKAALEDAMVVVVKRLKEVSTPRREFEQHLEVVGSVRHENVAPLRAYYYSKDEKLVVYDYYSQGSVSTMLHVKRGEDRIPLDWETRLRIAIGAARGNAHIHTQNGGKLVHGNIKASNIFLNSQQYGCISDLGLATLTTQIPSSINRGAGYQAPEATDNRKVSQASDVYSFGVLLLELLTGKSPVHATGGNEVVHLVRWVHSVVREEWTAEVFDIELLRLPNIEEQMVEMLQVGMTCVARMPDQRPKMTHVVKMVEDIRRIYTGNRPSTEGSTPTLTPPMDELESFSFPKN